MEWRQTHAERTNRKLPTELENPRYILDEQEQQRIADWQPQPRSTSAGEGGRTPPLSSPYRRLDKHLYLLTRPKGGEWSFPSAAYVPDEDPSTRAVAERALRGAVRVADDGGQRAGLRVFFVGNAPIAHWEGGESGAGPVFFHKAQVVAGAVRGCDGGTELAWVGRDEVREMLGGAGLGDVIERALVD
ncbi:unnamed protein product [Pedinophyceae sp. YPF-701]|nr:unnamed protein product [Pedinophyceae sp. YPF-701]